MTACTGPSLGDSDPAADVGRSVEYLHGTYSGSGSTEGVEPDGSGIIVVEEELPLAPPGTITELVGPESWGLCGITLIRGEFHGEKSGVQIYTNSNGFYAIRATKDVNGGFSTAAVQYEWSCEPLSKFGGLPPVEGASSAYLALTDTDNSGGSNQQNDPSLSALYDPEANAITWAGLTGPLTHFLWDDYEPNFIEAGAYPKPSGAFARDRLTGGSTGLSYEGYLVARTYTRAGLDPSGWGSGLPAHELSSFAYEIEVPEHVWVRQPEVSQRQFVDNEYLNTPTGDYWCILAGVSGGGQFDEPGTAAEWWIEVYPSINTDTGYLDYRTRVGTTNDHRENTQVLVECLAYAQ